MRLVENNEIKLSGSAVLGQHIKILSSFSPSPTDTSLTDWQQTLACNNTGQVLASSTATTFLGPASSSPSLQSLLQSAVFECEHTVWADDIDARQHLSDVSILKMMERNRFFHPPAHCNMRNTPCATLCNTLQHSATHLHPPNDAAQQVVALALSHTLSRTLSRTLSHASARSRFLLHALFASSLASIRASSLACTLVSSLALSVCRSLSLGVSISSWSFVRLCRLGLSLSCVYLVWVCLFRLHACALCFSLSRPLPPCPTQFLSRSFAHALSLSRCPFHTLATSLSPFPCRSFPLTLSHTVSHTLSHTFSHTLPRLCMCFHSASLSLSCNRNSAGYAQTR